MDDYFDDFDDGVFMDDDSFDDSSDENFEPEECFEDDPKVSDKPDEAESHDCFSAREAFFFGSAMGWAYEEGIEEAERRRLEKEMQDDKQARNRDTKI